MGVDKSDDDKVSEQDKEVVEEELKEVRRFIGTLKIEDLKNGSWFEKLLTYALSTYSQKVDAGYFRQKYPDLPADAVVQKRINMSARYAGIEGFLTSATYTGAIAATIGRGGGASPLTLPAGGAAFVVDLTYLSQAQIKLAYDISVLYQVPLDLEDPDDLWRLIRIAFSVKVGEGTRLAAMKGIPAIIRPVIKKYYARGFLAAAKSLPVIGKYLLQRNVIKFAVPVVGVPATVGVNVWTTKTAGRQAQRMMRTEARLIETASRISEENPDLVPTLWAIWLTMNAGGKTTEEQHTLLHHLTRKARERNVSESDLAELRNVVEIDEEETWARLASIEDLGPIYNAAIIAASVNGKPSDDAVDILRRMAELGGIEFNRSGIDEVARGWLPRSRTRKMTKTNKRKSHDTSSPLAS
jgi:hypothetical protein